MNIDEEDLNFVSYMRYELKSIAEERFRKSHQELIKEDCRYFSLNVEFDDCGYFDVTYEKNYCGCCSGDYTSESYDVRSLLKEWIGQTDDDE